MLARASCLGAVLFAGERPVVGEQVSTTPAECVGVKRT